MRSTATIDSINYLEKMSLLIKSVLQRNFWRKEALKVSKKNIYLSVSIYFFNIHIFHLKESYRIGKKQKSCRSQINIKLIWSNDDDSRKHHSFVFYSFFSFCIDAMQKCVSVLLLFSRDPDGRSISNF